MQSCTAVAALLAHALLSVSGRSFTPRVASLMRYRLINSTSRVHLDDRQEGQRQGLHAVCVQGPPLRLPAAASSTASTGAAACGPRPAGSMQQRWLHLPALSCSVAAATLCSTASCGEAGGLSCGVPCGGRARRVRPLRCGGRRLSGAPGARRAPGPARSERTRSPPSSSAAPQRYIRARF